MDCSDVSLVLRCAKLYESRGRWLLACSLYRAVLGSFPQNVHARRGYARVRKHVVAEHDGVRVPSPVIVGV